MSVKLLLKQRANEYLYLQRFLLLMAFLLLSSFGLQAQTVTTDKDDYSPGQYVIITGSGWQPGERVDFSFEETPKPATCVNPHDLYAIADADGNIYNNQFLVKENHLGVAFVLTATGETGSIAVTNFTDGNISFATSGLPSGSSIRVNWSHTQGQGVNGVETFNAPAPSSTIGVNSQTLTFIYEATSNGVSYSIVDYTIVTRLSKDNSVISTVNQTSNSFLTGGGNVTQVITANYVPSIKTTKLSVATASGTYGGTTTLTATLTSGTTNLSGKTVNFSVNGTSVGSAVTDVNGVATKTNISIAGINASTTAYVGAVTAFFSADASYSASSGSGDLTITPASATITVADLEKTYNGSSQGATVKTEPAGLAVNVTYAGSTIVPTAAGTYAVVAALNNSNYISSNGTGSLVIGKAATTTVVTLTAGPFTYTGSAITPASVTVTGAGSLSLTPDAAYADNINAGKASASYTYAGDANHMGSSDSKEFTIGKAASVTTVAITGGPFTYTGSAITPASVTVTGAGSLSLT
ncbi:MBG domain-containing protein, partial [Pontibacter chitinilyticus]|uniref:MBG domain-containing protein n=1 Tax=Pontibacter chitinilyticus TaxID=2674989 RepID=UPI00321BC8D5